MYAELYSIVLNRKLQKIIRYCRYDWVNAMFKQDNGLKCKAKLTRK
jgi:hypothetical protein